MNYAERLQLEKEIESYYLPFDEIPIENNSLGFILPKITRGLKEAPFYTPYDSISPDLQTSRKSSLGMLIEDDKAYVMDFLAGKKKLSKKRVPHCVEITNELYKNIPCKDFYGTEENGSWLPHKSGELVKVGWNKTFFTKQLQYNDLLKMVIGKSPAIATTEKYRVNNIRIDVDLDQIKTEYEYVKILKNQVKTLKKIGISNLLAYKTGCGHHFIIPLPNPLSLKIVSILTHVIRETLRQNVSNKHEKIDKANTDEDQLLRLPIGIHDETANYNRWINLKTFTIYTDPLKQKEISLKCLKANSNPRQRFFTMFIPLADQWLRNNKFRFLDDQQLNDFLKLNTQLKAKPKKKSTQPKMSYKTALSIWESYEEGNTYEFYFGGGIQAGITLYGDKAYEKIQQLGNNTPGSFRSLQNRQDNLDSAWDSYDEDKAQNPDKIASNLKNNQLIKKILKLHKSDYKDKQLKKIKKILKIMLLKMDSEYKIKISYRQLAELCNLDDKTVKTLIAKLIPNVFNHEVTIVKRTNRTESSIPTMKLNIFTLKIEKI